MFQLLKDRETSVGGSSRQFILTASAPTYYRLVLHDCYQARAAYTLLKLHMEMLVVDHNMYLLHYNLSMYIVTYYLTHLFYTSTLEI